MRATVTVPATSANLGPGFDVFGLALGLVQRGHGRHRARAPGVAWEGEGAGELPVDGTDMVSATIAAVARSIRESPPPCAIRGVNRDPARARARIVLGRRRRRRRRRVAPARPRVGSRPVVGVRGRRRDRGPPRQRGAGGVRRVHDRDARWVRPTVRPPSGAAAGGDRAGRARRRPTTRGGRCRTVSTATTRCSTWRTRRSPWTPSPKTRHSCAVRSRTGSTRPRGSSSAGSRTSRSNT